MCEQDQFEKDRQEYEARGMVTRRQFGVLLGAGMAMMLPKVVNAVAVTESDVDIKTPDGTCDAYFVHPATGTGAAVLIWPDIFGLRPAFRQMGKRLAESGYSVLVVNPFYRVKKAPTAEKGAATPIDQVRSLAAALTPPVQLADAKVRGRSSSSFCFQPSSKPTCSVGNGSVHPSWMTRRRVPPPSGKSSNVTSVSPNTPDHRQRRRCGSSISSTSPRIVPM